MTQYIGEFLGVKMYVSAGVSYSCPAYRIYGEATEEKLKNSIKRYVNKKEKEFLRQIIKKEYK